MKKIRFVIILFISLLSITSCKDNTPQLTTTINQISDCLQNSDNKITEKESSFSYHASTSTLTINKYNGFYSCEGEINVTAEIKDNVIAITEQSSSENKCTCPKDITYTIGNITAGSYKISINGKIIGDILIY